MTLSIDCILVVNYLSFLLSISFIFGSVGGNIEIMATTINCSNLPMFRKLETTIGTEQNLMIHKCMELMNLPTEDHSSFSRISSSLNNSSIICM